MRGFVFRLERLLQLRFRTERERAQALGQAMRREEAQRLALEEASEQLGRCSQQVAGVLDDVAPAGELTNLGLAIEAALRHMESAAESHQTALEQMQEERELFGRARVERRVVERLREKRQEAWSQEYSRAEQREHDGIAQKRRGDAGRSR